MVKHGYRRPQMIVSAWSTSSLKEKEIANQSISKWIRNHPFNHSICISYPKCQSITDNLQSVLTHSNLTFQKASKRLLEFLDPIFMSKIVAGTGNLGRFEF